jgi:hypothetical protein
MFRGSDVSSPASDTDWSRFRGPNGSGLSETKGLPTEFGNEQPRAGDDPWLERGLTAAAPVGGRVVNELIRNDGEPQVSRIPSDSSE